VKRGLATGQLIGETQMLHKIFDLQVPRRDQLEAMSIEELGQLREQLYEQAPVLHRR